MRARAQRLHPAGPSRRALEEQPILIRQAKESGMLRAAARGKGHFLIGSATRAEAEQLGSASPTHAGADSTGLNKNYTICKAGPFL